MAQLISVKLSRFDGSPWGFRLQGGKDFGTPLIVQKVNGGSPAEAAGLRAGDSVIKVNNTDMFSLRHKDAQDVIVRAGNSFEITVQRGGSTWRPSVSPVTPTIPSPQPNVAVTNISPVTKTSLAAKKHEGPLIGSGHNFSPKPFPNGTSDGAPIKSIVNKQYNSPVGIYSEQTIAETLSAQAEVLAGGVLGVNFKKNEKNYNAENSEVFKMVQEADKEPKSPEPAEPAMHSSAVTSPLPPAVIGLRPVSAPETKPQPTTPTTPKGGLPPGQNICAECERLIVGVFVRIKEKNLHVECFKCSTCGTSLKNVGYYNINNKLYCDIHAKLVARQQAPSSGYVPVTVPPGGKAPAGTISAALGNLANQSAPTPHLNGTTVPSPYTTRRDIQPHVDDWTVRRSSNKFNNGSEILSTNGYTNGNGNIDTPDNNEITYTSTITIRTGDEVGIMSNKDGEVEAVTECAFDNETNKTNKHVVNHEIFIEPRSKMDRENITTDIFNRPSNNRMINNRKNIPLITENSSDFTNEKQKNTMHDTKYSRLPESRILRCEQIISKALESRLNNKTNDFRKNNSLIEKKETQIDNKKNNYCINDVRNRKFNEINNAPRSGNNVEPITSSFSSVVLTNIESLPETLASSLTLPSQSTTPPPPPPPKLPTPPIITTSASPTSHCLLTTSSSTRVRPIHSSPSHLGTPPTVIPPTSRLVQAPTTNYSAPKSFGGSGTIDAPSSWTPPTANLNNSNFSRPQSQTVTAIEHGTNSIANGDTVSRVCCSCDNEITRGPFITALGQIWCPEHFVCVNAQCRRPLQDIGFVEEKGQLYCEYCFERFIAPQCYKCNNKIKGDCLNAIGKHYHPECFKCAYCGKLFGNSPFFLEEGLPYCEADWNELFTTKCFACGFPVEAGDRWVEALNNNYHSQCFNCTMCHKNLEGQSFYAKAGRPFCKNHAR